MRAFFNRAFFFIGWLLSPFTFWNDAFVNIPLSYLIADLVFRFVHVNFLTLVLVSYWLSNGLGILMMYLSGRKLVEGGRGAFNKELINLAIAIIAYSLLLALLNRIGILRPI